MKHIAHIVLLTMSLLLPITMKAQTPYDSFAPETSRPMLEADALNEELSHENHQADTILCAAVIDFQSQSLYLVSLADGTLLASAPLTDEVQKWLSVDPLVDKYIYASPYMYCGGNPIVYKDPDGKKVVYNDETGDCEYIVDELCNQSEMFKVVYNQLKESKDTYTFQFGKTVDNVDGQFVPSKNGGVITLNRDGAWSSSIPEETFHALQKDNNGKYNLTQLNLEFEAKVFVIMSGLPTGSYSGMDEPYHTSLLNIDIREFTQPQSITEYIKQANIYSSYNKNNAIGNKNYWTPTTISPYNLISIIGKLK